MAYQDYINCSREALLERMAELLPEKRLTHCLGVERAAIELAKRFGVDAEKAGLAGLLPVSYTHLVRQAFEHNMLILAFDQTAHNRPYTAPEHLFDVQAVGDMIAKIQEALSSLDKMGQALGHQGRHANYVDLATYQERMERIIAVSCTHLICKMGAVSRSILSLLFASKKRLTEIWEI